MNTIILIFMMLSKGSVYPYQQAHRPQLASTQQYNDSFDDCLEGAVQASGRACLLGPRPLLRRDVVLLIKS